MRVSPLPSTSSFCIIGERIRHEIWQPSFWCGYRKKKKATDFASAKAPKRSVFSCVVLGESEVTEYDKPFK